VYASVLVPIDGSQSAAVAIPHGVAIARQFGARLILLRALALPEKENGQTDQSREYETVRSQAQGYLESLKNSLQGSDLTVETRLETGDAASVIERVAGTLEDPLVVITAFGRTGRRSGNSATLGKVADQIVRECHTPILIISQTQKGANR
jgi:nucleotide-binding universal stress UspA family protein